MNSKVFLSPPVQYLFCSLGERGSNHPIGNSSFSPRHPTPCGACAGPIYFQLVTTGGVVRTSSSFLERHGDSFVRVRTYVLDRTYVAHWPYSCVCAVPVQSVAVLLPPRLTVRPKLRSPRYPRRYHALCLSALSRHGTGRPTLLPSTY